MVVLSVRNKRIAIVMPWHISERGGGAEVQANYLAQELARRGFDVHYVCQTGRKERIGSIEILNGFSIHWIKPSGKFPWYYQNKYCIPLETIKPDLVVQRMSSNVTYVIGKYCKASGIPFAWICTDNLCPFRDSHLRRFKERATLKNTNSLKYPIFYFSNLIMDFYRVKGMKFVTHAFTQNNFQESQVSNNYKLKSYRMISGHPIPDHILSIKERFNNRIILWCGNLGIHKRPDLFIQLAKDMASSKCRFIMVGGHADKDYVEQLLSKAPANIEITGQVTFDEANAYFDNATILVNTSESEGFSNTYIQAWLRGIPTIVFDADPDQVISNNNLGFQARDLEDAAQFISYLLSNYREYQLYSENVMIYAKEHHTIEIMTDNFLKQLGIENPTLHT